MSLLVVLLMQLLDWLWQVPIFDILSVCVLLGRCAVGVVMAIIYADRTFVCLHCGKRFRMDWYELFWEQLKRDVWWTRERVERDGVVYRRVWVRCPDCRRYDCGMEIPENKKGKRGH